jgi:hypothetical protein
MGSWRFVAGAHLVGKWKCPPKSGRSSWVDRVGRLGVGGLRAEVKAECRPDQTGESWQKLVEQLLGFVEVAMRGVEGHSRDGKQREDQRKRDGSAYPITSRLWIIAFFRILCWSLRKNGVVVVCGQREPHRGSGLAPTKKRPRDRDLLGELLLSMTGVSARRESTACHRDRRTLCRPGHEGQPS